jgi:hypothetical protein
MLQSAGRSGVSFFDWLFEISNAQLFLLVSNVVSFVIVVLLLNVM